MGVRQGHSREAPRRRLHLPGVGGTWGQQGVDEDEGQGDGWQGRRVPLGYSNVGAMFSAALKTPPCSRARFLAADGTHEQLGIFFFSFPHLCKSCIAQDEQIKGS